MPRHVTKTYGRSQKVSSASKVFDDLISKDSRPSTAMASSTMAKWGKTTFTSTRGDTIDSTRKRKVEEELDGDDPFSFDSDDEGPKHPKRGIGIKVADKKQKAASNGKNTSRYTSLGASKRNNNNMKASPVDSDGDGFNKDAVANKPHVKTYTRVGKSSNAGSLTSSQSSSLGSSSCTRQLSMDLFTRKLAEDDLIGASDPVPKPESRPIVRKFFTSSQMASPGLTDDHNYSFSGSSPGSVEDHTYSQSNQGPSQGRPHSNSSDSDFGNYDSDWDHESGDPEIVFNSPRKKRESVSTTEQTSSLHTQAVKHFSKVREPSRPGPCSRESPITIASNSDEHSDSDSASDRSGPIQPRWKSRLPNAANSYGRSQTPVSDADSRGSTSSLSRGVGALSRTASDGASRLKKASSLLDRKHEKASGPIVRRLLTSPKKVSLKWM